MAKTVLLIAAPKDYEALMGYCAELGLRTLPMHTGFPVLSPTERPVCYLGTQRECELHPVGKPPVRITDVKDPLLLFVRPHYLPPYLIDGYISLNEDTKDVSDQIRPLFEKIRRWVRKNWHKTDQFASYVGPEALVLLNAKQAEWKSHLHNAQGHIVLI